MGRYEEFTVAGSELVGRVRRLIREGNVRRVVIKNAEGRVLLDAPLAAGAAVTAVGAVFAPVLVAVGAVAAIVGQATVGVERRDPDEPR